MELTDNQLILLLEIHRGTLDKATESVTRDMDIVLLASLGLIYVGPSSGLECTLLGAEIIKKVKRNLILVRA